MRGAGTRRAHVHMPAHHSSSPGLKLLVCLQRASCTVFTPMRKIFFRLIGDLLLVYTFAYPSITHNTFRRARTLSPNCKTTLRQQIRLAGPFPPFICPEIASFSHVRAWLGFSISAGHQSSSAFCALTLFANPHRVGDWTGSHSTQLDVREDLSTVSVFTVMSQQGHRRRRRWPCPSLMARRATASDFISLTHAAHQRHFAPLRLHACYCDGWDWVHRPS